VTTPYDPSGTPHFDPRQSGYPPPGQPYSPPPGQPYSPPPGPQYGQPPAQPYSTPSPGQPWAAPYQPADAPGEPYGLAPAPKPKGHGRLIGLSAAAVIILGGGAATYVAVSSSSSSGGASDPKAAVQTLVNDLNNADLLGVLDDLPPAERVAVGKPLQQTFAELKRSGIVRQDASLSHVDGVTLRLSGLTYGSTITVNDHVRIVQLTGGTFTANADASKLPLTRDFVHAIAPNGLPASNGAVTVNLADRARRHPIRIATQRVGDTWYPSLLYTIADNVTTSAGLQAPSASDRIPAQGAASPDEAVRTLVNALLAGDLSKAIGVLSPDELAALHDYGKLIIDRVRYPAPAVTIKTLTFTDTQNSTGVGVALKSLDLVVNGQEFAVTVNGSCFDITAQGQSQHLCAQDIVHQILGSGLGGPLTAGQQQALTDLFSGIKNLYGMQTTEVGGQWYVNPVRSILDEFHALLSGLKPGDAEQLISIFAQH
jgi:hypothetical protein